MADRNSPTTARFHDGGRIDFLRPLASDVCWPFIAHRLANIQRFTGHPLALSVAAHSWMVAEAMRGDGHPPVVQLVGLLHDAHEAYTGDITAPLKQAMRDVAMMDVMAGIQDGLDRAIYEAAGIPESVHADPNVRMLVKSYDLRSRANEVRDHIREDPKEWGCDAEPLDVELYSTSRPEHIFLARFAMLRGEIRKEGATIGNGMQAATKIPVDEKPDELLSCNHPN